MTIQFPKDTKDASYNPLILEQIKAGNFEVTWGTIKSSIAGHTGEFRVFADALKIGGVRISVSAYLEQTIADMLGCTLLTPKLSDMIWQQRNVTLLPTPQPITSSSEGMIAHSKRIDAQLAAQGNPSGIYCTVGKNWVIDNDLLQHPGRAENYGWSFAGNSFGGQSWGAAVTPGLRLIQDRGWMHDPSHIDYSQDCVLVSKACLIDGQPANLVNVLQDATLAPLVSHQGPLKITRQPGVPEAQLIVQRPPCIGPDCPQLVKWGGENPTQEGFDWGGILASGAALAVVVGGFFYGLHHLGKARRS